MIRLTVLYNLPDGTDEEEFLEWRLTDHKKNNESIPGVLRTDFARVVDSWPDGAIPGFRFQTIVEWADRETFESGFYDDSVQAALKTNLERLGDYSFVVSETLDEFSA